MKHLAIFCALLPLITSWSDGWAQAPVLSTPFEDTVSPQLILPLSQASAASSRSGQGYGQVMWSIQPASASVDSILPQQPDQPQLPSQVAPQLPAFGSPAAGGLTSPASSWTAGGAQVTGSMLGRIAHSSQASSYTSASSFTPMAMPAVATAPAGNTAMNPALTSLQLQALQAQTLQFQALHAQGSQANQTGGLPMLVKAGLATSAPNNYQAAPQPSINPESPDAVAHAEGSPHGSHQATQSQPAPDADDDQFSHPLSTPSSSGTDEFAPRGFQIALVTAPTSAGMVIRLIATADGLQLVLQTKNAINGSILGDQSGTSRIGGAATEGWWAWGAGAGSWTPINVLTSFPLMNFKDPGESLIDGLIPKSKLDTTAGSADESISEQ
jgi:hypothetical protein